MAAMIRSRQDENERLERWYERLSYSDERWREKRRQAKRAAEELEEELDKLWAEACEYLGIKP
jgi:hypothetical protein